MKKVNKTVPENEINDCWNRIGIRGDGSCPELKKVILCYNCEIYSQEGLKLFERQLSEDYLNQWTEHLSRKREIEATDLISVFIFRIGQEWLAIQTQLVKEVADLRVIHSIPHRSNLILMGLVNIHGKIQLCISLKNLLGLNEEENPRENGDRKIFKRMIVLEWEGDNWAFPVDEVRDIYHFQPNKLRNVPETVAKTSISFTKGIIEYQGNNAGYLDHELVFSSLKRRIL